MILYHLIVLHYFVLWLGLPFNFWGTIRGTDIKIYQKKPEKNTTRDIEFYGRAGHQKIIILPPSTHPQARELLSWLRQCLNCF